MAYNPEQQASHYVETVTGAALDAQLRVDIEMESSRRGGSSRSSSGSGTNTRCRICFDAVTDGDLEAGEGFSLGCACRHGMELMHRSCAERWFRSKASCRCEVCGQPCTGLGPELTAELNSRAQQLAQRREEYARERARALAERPLLLLLYSPNQPAASPWAVPRVILGIFINSGLIAGILATYYILIIGADFVLTMCLSVGISLAYLLHWMMMADNWHVSPGWWGLFLRRPRATPRRPLTPASSKVQLHVFFALTTLLSLMG